MNMPTYQSSSDNITILPVKQITSIDVLIFSKRSVYNGQNLAHTFNEYDYESLSQRILVHALTKMVGFANEGYCVIHLKFTTFETILQRMFHMIKHIFFFFFNQPYFFSMLPRFKKGGLTWYFFFFFWITWFKIGNIKWIVWICSCTNLQTKSLNMSRKLKGGIGSLFWPLC